MPKDLQRVWDHVLTLTAASLSSPSLNWLKDTRPSSLNNNVLTVSAPSEFAKTWIESHYLRDLQMAWKEACGQACEIRFEVGPQEKMVAGPLFPDGAQTLPRVQKGRFDSSYRLPKLNPRYVFENFIVGASNRFAHAASFAVSEKPSKVYNPLFLYGGVGLGKTHLMQAIAHFVLANHNSMKVSYVSSETFTNELIQAIQQGSTPEFRNRYRGVDVLLIDDIQFVAGKDATQEEFFHTFDALHQSSKQIVISSDRSPKEIATLEERLRTRFEWGLICDIQPPDLETRIAILRKKAEIEGRTVPLEVCQYIAERIPSNIRELEGALIRVLAYTGLHRKEVTLDVAADVLRDLMPPRKPVPITLDLIKESVARFYDVSVADLDAKRRTRSITLPRQIAMYLCRTLTDASLPKIGQQFGGRDHTTVLYACDKISKMLEENPEFEGTLRLLTSEIKKA